MTSIAASNKSLPGVIRQLRPSDRARFKAHLLRLDSESRHDRFNGGTSDSFLQNYADRCFCDGATVVGYVEGDRVLGAAELHERPEFEEPTGEIAFSVERVLQHRGLGARLFRRLIGHAYALGYTQLKVTTHPNNIAMRRLAHSFGARISFADGESTGSISLTPQEESAFPVALPSRSSLRPAFEIA
ncbi:MAG TPA: GNAT family N-acetyltransferase [Tianweitania sediminis]|jgi:hypothetical protein|nr:GNAT family N-acetyltransferase [Tianweitania sediminis]